jgi:hypothetical protein
MSRISRMIVGLLVAVVLASGCTASRTPLAKAPQAPAQSRTPLAKAPQAPAHGFPSEDPSLPWACNPKTYDAKVCTEALAERSRASTTPAVNDPWTVHCSVDQVTTVRRCFMATFGQNMASDGSPYGRKSIPFQVIYYNTEGPYIMAGLHTFPGRHPIIRIDDQAPIVLQQDGGVSPSKPEPAVVEALRGGKIARLRYHVWPEGSRDAIYDLDGFETAWQRLLAMKDTR